MQNNFGTKGCMYCEGECNKECLSKEEPTMITDWLAEHGDPEIYKKVEKQLELEEAAEVFVDNRFTKQICGNEFYPDIYASKEAIVESHILFTKWQAENFNVNALNFEIDALKRLVKVLEHQQEKSYSEEDMSEAHFQGWVTRERFDDLSPDIIYPQGLDYEEKREYAFNLWLDKYKKK
jgi:hypothetical protein